MSPELFFEIEGFEQIPSAEFGAFLASATLCYMATSSS